MANENKTILLKLDLDTSGLVKQSEEASKQLTILKERQKELRKSGQENTVEYAKLKEEIRLTTKELNTSSSALLISEKQNGKTKQSVNDLMQVQKALSVQFNNLTLEEIENSKEGKKIAENYKLVNDALNQNSQKVGDGRRNVGLYKQAIIEANKEISGLKKEITQIGFAYGKTQTSVKDATASLNQMSATGQQNTEAFIKLENEVKDLNETLIFQESALKGANEELSKQEQQLAETEKEARKIGFVYGQNADSLSELKTAIREATDEAIQMENQFGKESKQYVDSIEKVGQLKDRMKDLKESTTDLAGGSGFEKFGNTLGGLKDDLFSLDFEGVSEKAKTLQSISKNMTFKEVIEGAKNLGSTFISLGKTIMANPLFLIAGVIAGIVGALIYFSQEAETAEVENEKINKSFERQSRILERNTGLIIDRANQQLKIAQIEGKSIEELAELERKVNIEKSAQREEQIRVQRRLIEDLKGVYTQAVLEENNELAKSIKGQIESEKIKFNSLKDLRSKQKNDIEIFELETQKAIKERTKQEIEDYKAKVEQKIELEKEIAERLRDLQLSTNELSAKNQRESIEKEAEFRAKIIETTIQDEVLKNEKLLKLAIEKNERLRLIDEQELLNSIERIKDNAKQEQAESKGTKEQIKAQNSEITKQANLEIESLNAEFRNKQKEAEIEIVDLTKNVQDAKVQAVNNANNEILQNLETGLTQQETALIQNGLTEVEISRQTAKQRIEIERAKNKAIQDDKTKTDAEKKQSEIETAKAIVLINKQQADEEIEIERAKEEQKKQINQASIQAVQTIASAFFELSQRQIAEDLYQTTEANNEKQESLQAQLEAGIISQEEFDKQKKELDKKYREEQKSLNKKAFETQKTAKIIEATINTALGVTASLSQAPPASFILAGITAGLGAVEIGLIASQQAPAFASGGKVLSGQRIGQNDGKPIRRANGDNLMASVKVGEVILNETQQALLGGNETFKRLGINGFADGGLVGGSFVGSQISKAVVSEVETSNLILKAVSSLPAPIVVVQDMAEALGNLTTIEDAANI